MNNYSSAAKQYGSIDLQSKTEAANPHQLIQMLIDGAINRIKTAINAARNGDWELSQSIITERDKKLSAVLNIDFSKLPADTQQQFRAQLEQLEELNTELAQLAIQFREEITHQKSSLNKSKSAINSYLDNALK